MNDRTLVDIAGYGAGWLREQNIDLIFVPVPALLEVVPEPVVNAAPVRNMLSRSVENGVDLSCFLSSDGPLGNWPGHSPASSAGAA